jgi:hypothetical protein
MSKSIGLIERVMRITHRQQRDGGFGENRRAVGKKIFDSRKKHIRVVPFTAVIRSLA